MSWDVRLADDRGHSEGDWNYTHNVAPMVYAALADVGVELAADTRPCRWFDRATREWHDAPEGHGTITWWQHLDGLSGPEGAAFLDRIIKGLEADPERFRAMNPANGWGDYDSFLKVLTEMRNAVPEWPTAWSTSG